MNTSAPSRNARSSNDAPSDASKARSENQPPGAKTQDEHAVDLFLAIKSRNVGAVIRSARRVDDLDSHFEKDFKERPLMLAARYDLPVAALQVLLERSNPRLANADGCTPLILAAWGAKPHSSELVRLLLPASDPLALMKGGDSALCYAIRVHASGNLCTKSISLLLPASDLDQRNVSGLTPLEQARRACKDEVIDLILGEIARRESEAIARCAGSSISTNSSGPRL